MGAPATSQVPFRKSVDALSGSDGGGFTLPHSSVSPDDGVATEVAANAGAFAEHPAT